jgi:predicted porin
MVVMFVGLQDSCGEAATAFLLSLRHKPEPRSPHSRLRNQAVRGVGLVPRLLWGIYVKKTFISAAAILAFAATAHADELSDIQAQAKQLRDQNAAMTKRLADLEKRQKSLEASKPVIINPVDALAADLPYKAMVKAKPPENDDICIKGICVYGAFDMGLGYQQNGSPYSPQSANPNTFLIGKPSTASYFGVTGNGTSVSFIGLRGKQEIGDGLYAIFNLQAAFNPASGDNTNGLASVTANNGLAQNLSFLNSGADSSRNGQTFGTAAYFGLSSPTYGTVTIGRQSSLTRDGTINYDPMGGAQAFSLLGASGTNAGGGSTENAILDNSYKYLIQVGPVRFAALVALREGGNSAVGNVFTGDFGFDYMGLSMDFVGGKIYDSVTAASLTTAQVQNAAALGLANGMGQFSGTVSDNTIFQVGARYTLGPWKFYGGYEYIKSQNPNNPLAPGALDEGYVITTVNNTNFGNDRILQTAWVGAKYAITPNLDVAGGYWHEWQNNFVNNTSSTTLASTLAACSADGVASSQCAGQIDAVSVMVDWRFAKHVDLYAGVMWAQVKNGLANGFGAAATSNGNVTNATGPNKASSYDPTVGLRYQF